MPLPRDIDERSSPTASRSVLLVDDHRVFVQVLTMGLERQSDISTVEVAHTAAEARTRTRRGWFDVMIVDLELPDSRGLDLIADLVTSCPGGRIVVLTAHARHDLAQRALSAGAKAFLGKDAPLEKVLAVLRGLDGVHLTAAARGSRDATELTQREQEVLGLLGQGYDPAGAAVELGISLHTTRGHIKSLMAKLGTQSQLGAVVAAHRRGLITVGSRF